MFHTLRSKLLVFFILIAFVPMLVVGFISYTAQKQEMTNHAEKSLSMQSSNIAADISRFLEERVNDAEYLSRNPVMMNPSSSLLDIRDQMYYFLDIHTIYYDTYLIDDEGIVIGDTENEVVGHDLSDRPWFSQAMEGKTFMSDIYYSTILDEPVLVIAAPVYDRRQNVTGVISPSFNLESLEDMLEGYASEQQETGWGGYAFLLNEEGTVISHPEEEHILELNYFDEQGVTKKSIDQVVDDREITKMIDGEVHSFSKIESFPEFHHEWYVGVSVEESELYASLNNLLMKYIISYGVILLFLLFAVYRLSAYLVQPVQQLVETTRNFASGGGHDRKYVNAYEEVNHLNATFDHMTRQLEQRENSHKKSTMVLEATDNGVLAIDRNTKRITLFNRMCEEVFQRDKNYVIGTTVDEVMTYSKPFASFVKSGDIDHLLETMEDSCQFEMECQCDGELRTYFLSVSNLPTMEEEPTKKEMLIVFYDLTEKRQMERELLRSEKLKVVGEMSAGFAHEIRNPLTTIKGFIQLFKERSSEENQKHYPLVIEEIDRVNKIMNELLNIANPNPKEEKTTANVERILKDIILLQESQMKKNHIDLETFFQGDIPDMEVNVNKLKQVFINLIQNGIEAMPDGGRMNIRTRLEDGYSPSEQRVVIQIQDTGIGMNSSTMEKLGTPFFTTKETGTGLGITTSYRVIEEMDGTINVSSETNQGTSFTISIPVKVLESVQ
ncbi:cache domain-containing protein [Salipaludibacillus daqingensis]|uniref:cache domain-containing protein n=1 Tax=Salipaludibacillus daqingensis TaxID=3041001 RepID=UPI0024766BA6|nr:cache domain-containing protein [Salipaludibacillus daqingensis]